MTETTSKHAHEHTGEDCHGRKEAPASSSQPTKSDEKEGKKPSGSGGCCG